MVTMRSCLLRGIIPGLRGLRKPKEVLKERSPFWELDSILDATGRLGVQQQNMKVEILKEFRVSTNNKNLKFSADA